RLEEVERLRKATGRPPSEDRHAGWIAGCAARRRWGTTPADRRFRDARHVDAQLLGLGLHVSIERGSVLDAHSSARPDLWSRGERGRLGAELLQLGDEFLRRSGVDADA